MADELKVRRRSGESGAFFSFVRSARTLCALQRCVLAPCATQAAFTTSLLRFFENHTCDPRCLRQWPPSHTCLLDDDTQAKGNAAFAAGDFEAAVQHFTAAIELDPSNHVLYSNRSAAEVHT